MMDLHVAHIDDTTTPETANDRWDEGAELAWEAERDMRLWGTA